MAKICAMGAGCEDEVVVRDGLLLGIELYMATFLVDGDHFPHPNVDIRLPAEHRPDRGRYRARLKDAGGDLVQQRLEQVEVCPVDQRDLDGDVLETCGSSDPAETSTYDHYARHACAGGTAVARADDVG